jgi:hypothetical protein
MFSKMRMQIVSYKAYFGLLSNLLILAVKVCNHLMGSVDVRMCNEKSEFFRGNLQQITGFVFGKISLF